MSDEPDNVIRQDLKEFLRIETQLNDLHKEAIKLNNLIAEVNHRRTEIVQLYGKTGMIFKVNNTFIKANKSNEHPGLIVVDVKEV